MLSITIVSDCMHHTIQSSYSFVGQSVGAYDDLHTKYSYIVSQLLATHL